MGKKTYIVLFIFTAATILLATTHVTGMLDIANVWTAQQRFNSGILLASGNSPGGTGACSTHQFETGDNADAAPTCAQPAASDVSGLAASATTDTTNASNISSGTLATARGGAGNSGTTVGTGGFWAGIGTSFAGNGMVSSGGAGDLTGNNVIHWHSFDIYATQVVGHISFKITTLVNPSTVDVGIYSADGQTLKVKMGGVSGASTGNVTANPAQVTLPPDTYIWAWCGTSSGTITNLAYQELNLGIDGIGTTTPLKNINGKRYGTSSNACSAGVLPSSLGTLTASSNFGTSYPPATWMEP